MPFACINFSYLWKPVLGDFPFVPSIISLALLSCIHIMPSYNFSNLICILPFRILLMMQSVAAQKAVNRMSCSAVAACMAPLLLRPLLAGDCEVDNDIDVGGDGSVQLLQAAAAANHAQAIVITLLEEYNHIFEVRSKKPFTLYHYFNDNTFYFALVWFLATKIFYS